MGQIEDYRGRCGLEASPSVKFGQTLRSAGASITSWLLVPIFVFGEILFIRALNKAPSARPAPVAMKPVIRIRKTMKSISLLTETRIAVAIGSVIQTRTHQPDRRIHAPAKKPRIRSVSIGSPSFMSSQIVADTEQELQFISELCLSSKIDAGCAAAPLISFRIPLLPRSTSLWWFGLPTAPPRDSQNWSLRIRRCRGPAGPPDCHDNAGPCCRDRWDSPQHQ